MNKLPDDLSYEEQRIREFVAALVLKHSIRLMAVVLAVAFGLGVWVSRVQNAGWVISRHEERIKELEAWRDRGK